MYTGTGRGIPAVIKQGQAGKGKGKKPFPPTHPAAFIIIAEKGNILSGRLQGVSGGECSVTGVTEGIQKIGYFLNFWGGGAFSNLCDGEGERLSTLGDFERTVDDC